MSEDLRFESEQAKADAIKNYDEAKGSQDELQRIMEAPISKANAEADIKPPQGSQPEIKKVEAPVESKAAVTPPQAQPIANDPESVAKAKGYKSFAEMAKAFDEKAALIDRQQKFINEKLNSQQPASNKAYEELLRKNQEYEQKLAALNQKQPQTTNAQVQNQQSKIEVIKGSLTNLMQRRKELRELAKKDPAVQLDSDWLLKMDAIEEEKTNLDMQLAEEMAGLHAALQQSDEKIKGIYQSRDNEILAQQTKEQYESEMNEIDEFQSNASHPEFKFSEGKDSFAVEAEYVNWANRIASVYYGSSVNVLKDSDREAVHSVLVQLQNGDPAAINACRLIGESIEPSEDVKKYLSICELLDHRDGKKKNPLTGVAEQQYRVVRDPMTGQFRKDPVRFPSLEDAYQHKIATDGTYHQKIKDAYSKGGKDTEEAIQKRNNAVVQMPNAAGASAIDVGLQMTPKQAFEKVNSINEQEALKRKMNGDPSLWNELENAMQVMMATK